MSARVCILYIYHANLSTATLGSLDHVYPVRVFSFFLRASGFTGTDSEPPSVSNYDDNFPYLVFITALEEIKLTKLNII